jgi:prepilin-type N-terminal cleavage/methylation domain-containing protein
MKRGFTLIEILIVIIIIGIMAGIGLPQYLKAVERGRTAEAKAVLTQIRSGEEAYYAHYGVYTTSLIDLDIEENISDNQNVCTSAYYYKFDVTSANGTNFMAQAMRCTNGEGGKTPDYTSSAYRINLTAGGNWAGTAGYY